VDWIVVVQDRDQLRALAIVAMNLRVPYNAWSLERLHGLQQLASCMFVCVCGRVWACAGERYVVSSPKEDRKLKI
jgi:hypothetical protein